MSDVGAVLARFAVADVTGWRGLPSGVLLADLGDLLSFDPDFRLEGEIGDPPTRCFWVPAASDVFDGGLRMWVDRGTVVLVEGVHPMSASREFGPAPDLGEPDGVLDCFLGPLTLDGGERVHADRGLALRVNPENGLLLGLLGFAPTTLEDYIARLRPVQKPTPLVPAGAPS
jgi:hypothetical protein